MLQTGLAASLIPFLGQQDGCGMDLDAMTSLVDTLSYWTPNSTKTRTSPSLSRLPSPSALRGHITFSIQLPTEPSRKSAPHNAVPASRSSFIVPLARFVDHCKSARLWGRHGNCRPGSRLALTHLKTAVMSRMRGCGFRKCGFYMGAGVYKCSCGFHGTLP